MQKYKILGKKGKTAAVSRKIKRWNNITIQLIFWCYYEIVSFKIESCFFMLGNNRGSAVMNGVKGGWYRGLKYFANEKPRWNCVEIVSKVVRYLNVKYKTLAW